MPPVHLRSKKRREAKNLPTQQERPSTADGISEDQPTLQRHDAPAQAAEKIPVIVKIEEKKKYLLESLLIVFSVLLALSLNELRAYWQEQKQTGELLANIKAELTTNKELAQFQQVYHQQVLNTIDSALAHQAFREKIFQGNDFNISLLTPEGIVARGPFNESAWNMAKSNNILSRAELKLISQLTDIYFQQHMIATGFEELKALYVSRESQKPENGEQTLKLMRKIYRGYITGRTPSLVKSYDKVIKQLEN